MPSYLVAQFSIKDASALAAYSQKAAAVMRSFDGKLVFKGSAEGHLFGEPKHPNIAVFEFPTASLLEEFYACEDYRDLEKIRTKGANMVLSAGHAPEA